MPNRFPLLGSGGGITASDYPLLAPNGTAAAPSYSFALSPVTGMFLPAANILGFSANGNEYLRIDGLAGGVTFNEIGLDVDFRIESNNQANMFTLDGGNDRVGIAIAPNNTFQVLDLIQFEPTLRNTHLGYQAGDAMAAGTDNTVIGSEALKSGTGNYNTAVGQKAMFSLTTEDLCTAVGHQAGYFNLIGNALAAFGASAGYYSTGDNCTYLGTEAGYYPTTGNANTYVGAATGRGILGAVGGFNTAVGSQAMSEHDNAGSTVAIGYATLQRTVDGNQQTAVGAYSGFYQTNGHQNTLLGYYAGYGVSGSDFDMNTCLGARAGQVLDTGSNNILVGYKAGDNLTTGGNNIYIGYDIDAPAVGSGNTMSIGNIIFATGLDGTGTTPATGNVGIKTATPDYALDVAGDIGIDEYIRHNDDADTFIRLQVDEVQIRVGAVDMLIADETTQNTLKLGDTAGTKDVDVNISNGQVFVEGSTGNVGFATITPDVEAQIELGDADKALLLNRGTTAQRPAAPVNGMIRYNTTTSKLEGYEGGGWANLI